MATSSKRTGGKPAAKPAATVAVPTTVAVPATTVAVPATYMGVDFAALSKTQQGFATRKVAPTLAAATAGTAYKLGRPYGVSSGNNRIWWGMCMDALAAGGGTATAAAMAAAGACPLFVGYVVRKGYLAAA